MGRSGRWWGLGLAVFSLVSCGPETKVDDEPVAELRSALKRGGDKVYGRDLLVNNGTPDVPYLSCGMPRGVVTIASWFGIDLIGTGPKLPGRSPAMADLPYSVSLATTPSQEEVVTTNCLLCHASKLGDSIVIGLGNPNVDFTQDQSVFGLAPLALDVVSLFLTPAENVELRRYRRVTDAEATVPRPTTIGLNPADVMFGVLASHRDQDTLQWLDQPTHQIYNVLFTDVPAWWNTKRRPNLFHSGFGRGDHARIMMTASLMCLEDTEEAANIDAYFGHIEAFIDSLEPPEYNVVAKRTIDSVRAERGYDIYKATCKGCHGDSKANPPVPQLEKVLASVVGTDPDYAKAASLQGDSWFRDFFDFFNESWYGTAGREENLAGLLVQEPDPIYQPPPLDGVWATAPYFHNGSVPTLEAVLKPSIRPTLFRRSFKPEEYDFGEKVGWPYVVVSSKGSDTRVYDTRVPGYKNTGHAFAAGLTDAQRRDLLEYLKTL